VFLELDRVKQDENISGVQLVEVSKPGKVLRLVDGDFMVESLVNWWSSGVGNWDLGNWATG